MVTYTPFLNLAVNGPLATDNADWQYDKNFSLIDTWAKNLPGYSGAVSSVFGRTGAVAAASGDYAAFYDALGAAATALASAEASAASLYLPISLSASAEVVAGAGAELTFSTQDGDLTLETNDGGTILLTSSGGNVEIEALGTGSYIELTASDYVLLSNLVISGATPTVTGGHIGFGTTTSSTATAGAISSPGNFAGFLEVNIGGTVYKLPYFAA